VGVDEARHQNPAPAVDDPGVRLERRFRRLDRLDPPAIYDNPQALQQRVRLAVEQQRICERDARDRGPEAPAVAPPEPAAKAPNVAPMATTDDGWENFFARCVFSRANAGVWQRQPGSRGA
jgi:hypothetical protein